VVNHPFQNVYFTPVVELFGGRSAFERDYWALSARQALEHILANDDREAIAIWSGIGEWEIAPNLHIMPADDQPRITLRDHRDSPGDYIIETYRLGPGEYPFAEEWFSIVVDGLPIMTVYAVNDAAEAQPLPP
jgi:hypothetical protein